MKLHDIAKDLLKEGLEQDAKYHQILEDYGVTTPAELSESNMYKFIESVRNVLGEAFLAELSDKTLRKFKDAANKDFDQRTIKRHFTNTDSKKTYNHLIGVARANRKLNHDLRKDGPRKPNNVSGIFKEEPLNKPMNTAVQKTPVQNPLSTVSNNFKSSPFKTQNANLSKLSKPMKTFEELDESLSHEASELVIHGDNSSKLYKSSHLPIVHNLEKKYRKGQYDHEKAKKLWAHHADRTAQSYAKEYGDGTPWHKMFSTAHRKEAATEWANNHKAEMEVGNFHRDPAGYTALHAERRRTGQDRLHEAFVKSNAHPNYDTLDTALKKYGYSQVGRYSNVRNDYHISHYENPRTKHDIHIFHHDKTKGGAVDKVTHRYEGDGTPQPAEPYETHAMVKNSEYEKPRVKLKYKNLYEGKAPRKKLKEEGEHDETHTNHNGTYRLKKRLVGHPQEWHSIIKTHDKDGNSLQNQWGGYEPKHGGQPAYVKKRWNALKNSKPKESIRDALKRLSTHFPLDKPLDEASLSKPVLRRYTTKAVGDLRTRAYKAGTNYDKPDEKGDKKRDKRHQGILRAVYRLSKEELDETNK